MIEQRNAPVIAAPMAGGISTPELVAAVGGAGGFGFLAAGYLAEDDLAGQIRRVRELSSEPFGVNLFVPGPRRDLDLAEYRERVAAEAERYGVQAGSGHWDDDLYQAKVELVIDERVPVVSFTFGRPERSTVDRLHEAGAQVVCTVTTPDEARLAAEVGVDLLCVQGSEAGGHRGVFEDDPDSPAGGEPYGLLGALRTISGVVDLPLVGAGGVVTGADLAAVLSAGAVAAQLGTAFLVSAEAGTAPTQRAELAAGTRSTAITRAFSGRPARGLVNRFLREHGPHAPAAYPQLHHLTKPVRGAAGRADDPEAMSLWAGQTYAQVTPRPAAELVRELVEQARTALDAAGARLR
ncbi:MULTISPECIES: nitronate monooxygenase [unclassified Saccharopolyspora]|uniref:nitronate monooxygenase n=1 Tax=unclassified Saccharopolyspora TaxID=2646250 RepID=UPI001CD2A0FD|nr:MULTISPECIES: nitronate monooxygenase [unclassified Saccharopolyspora]MCA1189204.1 nitronate monooxygenase [Saccharopolyspora sp. 6T]MCA1282633.1 nitronate monooxygenase [Saccharopolyspora sp. 7B]